MVGGVFFWNVADDRKDREELAFETARAFFLEVVLARSWNARHGGVYVVVTKDTQPNPYLDDPLRDIIDTNGIRLTKINPAYMTRQIAEIAAREQGIRFHITSLKPIRPENGPTEWEKAQLLAFERGVREYGEFFSDDSKSMYRYMAPLFVKAACLKCHEKHGYKEGDVRGGISIAMPYFSKKTNRSLLTGYGIAAVSGLILIVVGGTLLARNRRLLVQSNEELNKEIDVRTEAQKKIQGKTTELQSALDEIKTLKGILPLCSFCKKIRNDDGSWEQLERYISDHYNTDVSHGVCPECLKENYPEVYANVVRKKGENNL